MKIKDSHKDFTRSLNDLGSDDLLIADGKGSGLGEMLNAGLPVPDGFVVLTRAYHDFVVHNGLYEPVRVLLEDVPTDDPACIAEAAHILKTQFIAGNISTQVAEAISRAYDELGGDGPSRTDGFT